MKNFNKLTAAETERLAILAEEASEVIKAVTKILRHGYISYNPDAVNDGDNRGQLCAELGDFKASLDTMIAQDDVDGFLIEDARQARLARFNKYTHHQ